MAKIPSAGVVEPTLPGSRDKNTRIAEARVATPTPQATFTTPYISGATASKVVGNIADKANQIADTTAVNQALEAGQKDQQTLIDQGKTQYLGISQPFTLTDKAYAAGAKTAYVSKAKTDINTKFAELKTKYQNQPELWSKSVTEFENQLFKNTPSDLTLLVREEFDKRKGLFDATIATQNIKLQHEENIVKIEDGIERDSKEIFQIMGQTGDLNNPLIEDLLISIDLDIMSLKQNGGFSDTQILEQSKKFKNFIGAKYLQTQITKHLEARDIGAIDKIKQELKNGTYTYGEFGEKYGEILPGGKEITLVEGQTLLTQVEDQMKNYTKDMSFEIKNYTKDQEDITKAISTGSSKHFKAEIDDNGNTIVTYVGPSIDAGKNVLYNGKNKHLEMEVDRQAGIIAGKELVHAKLFDLSQISARYSRVDELEQLAEEETDSAKAEIYSRAAVLLENGLNDLKKETLDGMNKTGKMDRFLKKRNFYNNTDPLNFDNEAGIDNAIKKFEEETGQLYVYNDYPDETVNLVMTRIDQLIATNDVNQMVAGLFQYDQTYGKHSINMIRSHIDQNDKPEYHVISAALGLIKAGKTGAATELLSANQKMDEYKAGITGKITTEQYNAQLTEFENSFTSSYVNDTSFLATSFGQEVKAMAMLKWHKLKSQTNLNSTQIRQRVNKFIEENTAVTDPDKADPVRVPLYYAIDDEGNSLLPQIEKMQDNYYTKPWMYNVVLQGQTYERFMDNPEMFPQKFDYERLVTLDSKGNVSSAVKQKRPSDGETLIMSDAVITPNENYQITATFGDTENAWEPASKDKFFKALPKDYAELKKERDIVAANEADAFAYFDLTDDENNNLITYEQGLVQAYATQTYIDQDGIQRNRYKDWIVPNIVGTDSNDNAVLQAISLKASVGRLEDMDLLTAMRNSTLLQKLGFGSAKKRAFIIDQINNNLETLSRQITVNDAPTRVSPWQMILMASDQYIEPRQFTQEEEFNLQP